MKVTFEIFFVEKGKKASASMADIAAKLIRAGIGSCVVVDVKNRVLAVQADAGRKGAGAIGETMWPMQKKIKEIPLDLAIEFSIFLDGQPHAHPGEVK